MYEVKKIGKLFRSKFVRTGPSSYKNRIYRAAVSQSLRNTRVGSVVPGIGRFGGCVVVGVEVFRGAGALYMHVV